MARQMPTVRGWHPRSDIPSVRLGTGVSAVPRQGRQGHFGSSIECERGLAVRNERRSSRLSQTLNSGLGREPTGYLHH